MARTVLVTGAGGFIGSHLVDALLERGDTVRAMVRYSSTGSWGWLERYARDTPAGLEILATDIRDPFSVSGAVRGCSLVFHLASLIAIPYSYHAPASYVDTNVTGTLNVLQACREHGTERMVHTSTSEVYGTAQYVPIDERHPLVGQSPYSATKIAADKLVESFHLSFGLPLVTLRPFNTFGPRQSARAVIPTVITQALAGSEVIRLGAVRPVRDMNFVTDTVSSFLAAASCDACVGQTLNSGRGEGISIGDLAREILDLCGSHAEIATDERRLRPERSEVLDLVCDSSRLRETTGWRPAHTLREGLEKTIAWFRDNREGYKEALYNV